MKCIKDEAGFTLIEALVALIITTLTLSLLSMGITHFKHVSKNVDTDRQLEWHLCLNQLEHYLTNSELVAVSNDKLVVKEYENQSQNKVTAEYRMVNQNFVRRVNNGTQQLLMNLKSIQFEIENRALLVKSAFYTGEQYQAKIRVSSWDEQDVEE